MSMKARPVGELRDRRSVHVMLLIYHVHVFIVYQGKRPQIMM